MEIDYTAVRDDLKERIEQLQVALVAVENILASVGHPTGRERSEAPREAAPGDFLSLSIPDAAKKFLESIRSPQTIAQIHEAIKRGGLPHTKYNAVYTAIWRREGEFARLPGSDTMWGLAGWWPASQGAKKKAASGAKAAAKKKPHKSRRKRGVPIHDLAEQLLRDEGKALHASTLIERLEARFNRITKVRSLSGSMPKDPKKRFENLGGNMWVLTEWPLSQKQIPE